jgi:hypothetical protein
MTWAPISLKCQSTAGSPVKAVRDECDFTGLAMEENLIAPLNFPPGRYFMIYEYSI